MFPPPPFSDEEFDFPLNHALFLIYDRLWLKGARFLSLDADRAVSPSGFFLEMCLILIAQNHLTTMKKKAPSPERLFSRWTIIPP